MRILVWLPLCGGCALLKLSSLERSFPDHEGVIEIAASDPVDYDGVTIARDAFGVPHVRGATEAGAWFGLGLAHGQDRLFQADLARQLAYGNAGVWLGERLVPFDHFVRSMHLEARAQRWIAGLNPETRQMLEAYTAGLNAGAASLEHLPIEYRVLGRDFAPWSAHDCLAILFLQSWTLSSNPAQEIAALRLAQIEPDRVDALLRTDRDVPAIDPYWEDLRQAQIGDFTPAFRGFVGVLGGAPLGDPPPPTDSNQASNNWVVGGAMTASGAPIVANDPHLYQGVPSLWYVADVAGGALHVAGATLPGTPGVPVGHNVEVAWGLTNVMADVVDFVVLERDGDTGYRLGGRRETLRRTWVHSPQGDGPHRSGEVWTTSVGPVITELEGTHLVVMRWIALEVEDRLPEMLHGIAHAESVADIAEISRLPAIVAQNIVAADTDGGFGWQVSGSVPHRPGHTGRVPYPGSEPGFGWDGLVEDRPFLWQPESGFVATANSRPDHAMADALGTGYLPDHRLQRIRSLLSDRGLGQVPEDHHQIQKDQREVTADRFLTGLLDGVTPSAIGAPCYGLLDAWDRVAAADSAAAAVWVLFHRELMRHAVEDELGSEGAEIYLAVASSGASLLESGSWSTFAEDPARSVNVALNAACTLLTASQGEDPGQWTLGALRPLRLQHPIGARRPGLLSRWNMPDQPWGGTGATVAAAGYSWSRSGELPVTGMASLRLVMPLDDLGASTLVHPGGQSGMPDHPLFRSHFGAFVNGRTLPLWFDDDDVAENTVWTLEVRRTTDPAILTK